MSRIQSFALFALTCGACTPTIVDSPDADSDHAPWVSLEGEALTSELGASPVRQAEAPFARIGVTWDASAPGAIEIATSVDGDRWSTWEAPTVVGHEVEGERTNTAFVGVIDLDEPATYYRIRGRGSVAFIGLEMLAADAPEDGDTEVADAAALVGINGRASWGARAAKCSSNHTPTRFTIHHTVTPTTDSMTPQARLRNIQAYHQDVRGWCDIAYNFLVSRDGRLWEGRGAGKVGSHVAGQNTGNIGVSFLGTYTTTAATSTQTTAAANLIADLGKRYGIARNKTTIKGHRDRGQTSCPGDKLYAQIGGIVSASQTGALEPPPAVAPTTLKGVVYRGDDPNARIANATITLGDRTTTTSASGYYELPNVIGTTFRVTASAPGYAAQAVDRAPVGSETWASISLTPQ